VVAVFDRLGCNAAACHGSFHGQNGFRLSLFGGDPALDYLYVARKASGRRLNLVEPERSLLLLKPTLQVPHRGGLRLHRDSPEHRLLLKWIGAGARYEPDQESPIAGLEIAPPEAVLATGTGRASLRVTARYADRERADVTALARFET
jgi:hypothetical protein